MDDVDPARGRLATAPAAVHLAVTSPNYVGNWAAAFSRQKQEGKSAHVVVENPDRDV
jgi:hypothetical protein